jgi:hypothetical protein
MIYDEEARRRSGMVEKRGAEPNERKFYFMSHDFARGGPPGFKLENEETLKNGRRSIANAPRKPGFPDFPDTPRFLFDKRLGREPRDLEEYDAYWVVSQSMKQILETADSDGVAFLKCGVELPDGRPGPDRWLCDVLRVLDAVDEEASSIKIKYEGTRKIYSLMGRPNVIFKDEVVGRAHLFRMAYLEAQIVCDEELRIAIRVNKLTGASFQDAMRQQR